MTETTIAGRFTIRWDTSMGCYRVSVPNLCSDGEPVARGALGDREARF